MADDAVELLPLFPLGHVLMPGCPLPLRVFEPRYRRLLADVTDVDGPRRFGVVALTAGLEVDSGLDESVARFAQIGTVAEILEVHPGADGSANLLTGGSQRFRVHRLVETPAPYLVAEVSFLAEVEGEMPESLPGSARALSAEYFRLMSALVNGPVGSSDPLPDDTILLSYRLAADAPLSQADSQTLLEDETATARLLHVQRVLRREVVLLRRTRTIAVSPGVLQVALRPN